MKMPEVITERIQATAKKIEDFDRHHPEAIDLGITSAIGGAIGITAEAAAMKLAERPTTTKNALGRSALHAVAFASAALVTAAYREQPHGYGRR